MTEIDLLRRRRELVVLAAELQRATVLRRLERIEDNPARRILGMAASAVHRPVMLKVGGTVLAYAVRALRRKRSKPTSHTGN